MVNQPTANTKTGITLLGRKKLAERNNVPVEAICPKCGSVMEPIYENNGFQAPDPEKIELSYYLCRNCGNKEE